MKNREYRIYIGVNVLPTTKQEIAALRNQMDWRVRYIVDLAIDNLYQEVIGGDVPDIAKENVEEVE